MFRCPGHEQRFWKPEDIFEVNCTQCGKSVEYFKDEPKLKCGNCGCFVVNPKIDIGCAEWCKHSEQCTAVTEEGMNSVCDKLIDEMKEVFGRDTKRIEHALSVLDFAEKIHAAEGGDALVIKASAILHDIGIHEAERKHGSAAGKYQEIEGPPIATDIMKRCGLSADAIEHICKIVANHHSAKDIDTIEFRIIWDADNLVNLQEETEDFDTDKIRRVAKKRFKTKTGYSIAGELLIKNKE